MGVDQVSMSKTGPQALMRLPVPWVFVIGYLVGIATWLVVPVSIDSPFWLTMTQIIGGLAVAFGVILIAWAQRIFHEQHTTTVPTETTTSFVTWGPYRLSRNPMYLGLFSLFVGLSAVATFVWSILFLVVVLFYVNSVVIPVEEKQLQTNFGEAYDRYRNRVRRWI